MYEDRGLSAHHLSAGRDREAVIAVGRAGHGHGRGNGADRRVLYLLCSAVPPKSRGRLREHASDDGIGSAQGLEAAQTQPLALVFDIQAGDSQLRGQRRLRRERAGAVSDMREQAGPDEVGRVGGPNAPASARSSTRPYSGR